MREAGARSLVEAEKTVAISLAAKLAVGSWQLASVTSLLRGVAG